MTLSRHIVNTITKESDKNPSKIHNLAYVRTQLDKKASKGI